MLKGTTLLKQNHPKALGPGIALVLYFTLKPLYLNDSGSLQICDIVLLGFIALFLLKTRGVLTMSRPSKQILLFFAGLLCYQALDNMIWSIVTGDMNMNRQTAYYVFNFLAFATCICIGEEIGADKVKRSIGLGCLFSVLVTAVGIVYVGGTGIRTTGFFNNPNQLGYYGLIMLTALLVCKNRIGRFAQLTILLVAFWATVVSLSKAAIVGFFVELLVLILLYRANHSAWQLVLRFFLIALAGITVYILFFSESDLVVRYPIIIELRKRMLNMMSENDSSLSEGRGYARVLEMLPHLLWGTGEGAYERFVIKNNTEVHSTFISLLTCYGVVGLFGYLYLFGRCMGRKKHFLQSAQILLGLLLYSMTHNGIRNTLLWLLLAAMFLEQTEIQNQEHLQWLQSIGRQDSRGLLPNINRDI